MSSFVLIRVHSWLNNIAELLPDYRASNVKSAFAPSAVTSISRSTPVGAALRVQGDDGVFARRNVPEGKRAVLAAHSNCRNGFHVNRFMFVVRVGTVACDAPVSPLQVRCQALAGMGKRRGVLAALAFTPLKTKRIREAGKAAPACGLTTGENEPCRSGIEGQPEPHRQEKPERCAWRGFSAAGQTLTTTQTLTSACPLGESLRRHFPVGQMRPRLP